MNIKKSVIFHAPVLFYMKSSTKIRLSKPRILEVAFPHLFLVCCAEKMAEGSRLTLEAKLYSLDSTIQHKTALYIPD